MRDTEPMFLQTAVNQISNMFSQSSGSAKEDDMNHVADKKTFKPMKGATKIFPHFPKDKINVSEEQFSKPEQATEISNAWTPHLKPPVLKRVPGKEGNAATKRPESNNTQMKARLERFKKLLMRQKKIKKEMFRSLEISKRTESPINSMLLENGSKKENSGTDAKPFIGLQGIDEVKGNQRQKRITNMNLNTEHTTLHPSRRMDNEPEGMIVSENRLGPVSTQKHSLKYPLEMEVFPYF